MKKALRGRGWVALTLTLALLVSLLLGQLAYSKVKTFQATVKLYNKSEPINALIIHNRTYVDLNSLRKLLDMPVRWSYADQLLYVGKVGVDVSPILIRGMTYVPIRDVARAAGYSVSWEQSTRTVVLTRVSSNPIKYSSKADIKVIEHNVKIEKEVHNVTVRENGSFNKTSSLSSSTSLKSSGSSKDLELPPVPEHEQKVEFTHSNKPTGAFIPRYAQNDEFLVTVTDLKITDTVKTFYHPSPGKKFVVVFVSQQNVSNKIQVYTGRFYLVDDKGAKYDYIEGLSNYWLQVLIPNGINFGSLVFEIPKDRYPAKLVLETYGNTPLVVNLM